MKTIIANSGKTVTQSSRRWLAHFVLYTFVGAISAACDLAVFIVMAEKFSVNYLLSTAASFVAGTTINFLICLKFVLRLNGHSWVVASWRKLLSGLAALAVNLSIMFLLVDVMGFGGMKSEKFLLLDGLVIARGLAICAGFFLNFVLTKYYAFRDY